MLNMTAFLPAYPHPPPLPPVDSLATAAEKGTMHTVDQVLSTLNLWARVTNHAVIRK